MNTDRSSGTDEIQAFIQGLRQAEVVALDTETTGLSVMNGRDYMMGFSLAYKAGPFMFSKYFPLRHETGNLERHTVDTVMDVVRTKILVFHNRKFDLHSLATAGYDVSTIFAYDTMLMAHMIHEERPYAKTLEACGQQYLKRGKVQKKEIENFTKVLGWGALPPNLINDYACGDAELTLDLYEVLKPLFEKEFSDKGPVLWADELKIQTILYKMEALGVKIDVGFCSRYAGIASLEMMEIESSLGFTPSKTTALSKFMFDGLKLPVLDYTPAGKPSLNKAVMGEYDRLLEHSSDDRARQVLNYRGWQKASSAFYTPIPKLVDSNNRVHCSFKQHGTSTGRLSCAEPNFQQIPRSSQSAWSGKARNMFLPSEGFSLLNLDYSQLELRLAAAYGSEKILIEEFAKDDSDPFTVLAEEVGVDRFVAKTMAYGLLYGAGQEKLAKILNKPVSEVEVPYNKFLKSIPGIIKVKQACEIKARQRGYIQYWTGRRRHFTNRDDAYKSFNSLIQGGAAEIVKQVMINVDAICDEDCRMLLQVHDSLMFEIRTDKYDDYKSRIVEAMEFFPTNHFGVRFRVA